MRRSRLAAIAATVAVLAPVAWFWQHSLLPDSYSATEMGYPDWGGGHAGAHGAGIPLDRLTAPADRPADVSMTMVARRQSFDLAPGMRVDGYTFNGRSPGPEIRARQGQLVEVRLVNESVPEGVTLHWHGVDVPNAADGVAGVTQDAVPPGESFAYRFVATRAGTYWYHSHQLSHEQVRQGLFGALVISEAPDVVALVHVYNGHRTVNGLPGAVPVTATGTTRVRVINTDNGPMAVWTGAPYRLVAIDGGEVHGAAVVTGQAVTVTAGGRADLEVEVGAAPVRVELGGSAALVLTPSGDLGQPVPKPGRVLDPLHYGTPATLGFDPDTATRRFEYAIGRRPGLLDGMPGMWWTINGHQFPDVPMFMVSEGDVVRMRVSNGSGEVHPMHLHGHRAVVLSRNGEPASGSPWWVDSLNVEDGETYELAFVADNPGIWMDHCHNLPHAAEGLVTHLMYAGVTSPYRISAGNHPE
ncbi:multicopper oxidase family protein [Amycolatopsis alkalitolerans]|uniref:Multicopper oxidase family protein n=1 Tax=Amycolatopsis alkalitolerans TaxID=2547244 RepID=A0A5C4MAD4_9PSEU|nr:multicopper oxidase family protein [Amycolatopsis alkalitolerans]TNC28450.1 multicopper oxidase family protein [Amycolatopsis alkalitolerans]